MKQIIITKEIFSKTSLERAMQDYSNLCEFSIAEKADEWEVRFSNCRFDEQRTVNEFENYLIGLENN